MKNNVIVTYMYGKPFRWKVKEFETRRFFGVRSSNISNTNSNDPTIANFCRVSQNTNVKITRNQSNENSEQPTQAITKTQKHTNIGGLNKEKQSLMEIINLTLHDYELFLAFGIKPTTALLLHGPPGTGKTLLVKNLALECKCELIVMNGPEFLSANFGESESKVSGE